MCVRIGTLHARLRLLSILYQMKWRIKDFFIRKLLLVLRANWTHVYASISLITVQSALPAKPFRSATRIYQT